MSLISVKSIWSCKTMYVKLVQREKSRFGLGINGISILLAIVSLRISKLFFEELIFKLAIKLRLGF